MLAVTFFCCGLAPAEVGNAVDAAAVVVAFEGVATTEGPGGVALFGLASDVIDPFRFRG